VITVEGRLLESILASLMLTWLGNNDRRLCGGLCGGFAGGFAGGLGGGYTTIVVIC